MVRAAQVTRRHLQLKSSAGADPLSLAVITIVERSKSLPYLEISIVDRDNGEAA